MEDGAERLKSQRIRNFAVRLCLLVSLYILDRLYLGTYIYIYIFAYDNNWWKKRPWNLKECGEANWVSLEGGKRRKWKYNLKNKWTTKKQKCPWFFSQHFIPDNICMVSLYSGSQTLSPVRAPLWLNETILVGAGCSGGVQLQKNLSGLQFVILFSFKMMLGLCFPDIRGSNERSWVTIPWGQQGFQQSLALSDELRLHFGGGQEPGSSPSATGHTNDHSACFTPGGHSSYLRRTFEFIKYFI